MILIFLFLVIQSSGLTIKQHEGYGFPVFQRLQSKEFVSENDYINIPKSALQDKYGKAVLNSLAMFTAGNRH